MRQDGKEDRLTAIGRSCGVSACVQAGSPVGQPKAAQTQVAPQLADVLAAGFVALGVVGEQGGRDAGLVRHEGHHRRRRDIAGRQDVAWKAQQAELDGEAEPVAGAPLAANQRQVFQAEDVMAGHIFRNVRDGEEPGALLGGEKAAAGHESPWRGERLS